MTKVLVAGDWTDNYLTLGGKTLHVGAEDLAAAQREAEGIVGDTLAGARADLAAARANFKTALDAASANVEAEVERRVKAEFDKISEAPKPSEGPAPPPAPPAIVAENLGAAGSPAPEPTTPSV
mgnify:CR=1 FL=1